MATGYARPEFPNPQFERSNWMNLNGTWEFEIDAGVSGIERKLYQKEHLDGSIQVPFCPESKLSGVENKDFLNCVWYRRDVLLPETWKNGKVLLNFGAVDHTAVVYVNGVNVGEHRGGYVSFSMDITHALRDGINSIHVCAIDNDCTSGALGHGKQSQRYESYGCYYTRVTGIWQTVWLEFVPDSYIRKVHLTPDIYNQSVCVEAELCGGGELTAEAFYEGKSVGSLKLNAPYGGPVKGTLPLSELHLWEVGHGRLYDLKLTYGEDTVSSYFGMRHIAMDGYRFLLNGKSVYQRLVLDQGFYKDGIYTAPSDEALAHDIEISIAAGFNGARLHQKVFEPRFLYHCDRMGYLTWGEYGSWGLKPYNPDNVAPLVEEWNEIIDRDYNHPSIIGWCPLNEVWEGDDKKHLEKLVRVMYEVTVQKDSTRPCIDTSGGIHIKTDIFDTHDYIQDPELFRSEFGDGAPEEIVERQKARRPKVYNNPKCAYIPGTAFWVSEYGGIKWDVNSNEAKAWGYGDAPETEEEFKNRYKGLTDTLLDHPMMFGFCYTQLYDVEQEVNGLYTYEREPKFDMEFFRKVNTRKAAIED